jgi:hypothetical protein
MVEEMAFIDVMFNDGGGGHHTPPPVGILHLSQTGVGCQVIARHNMTRTGELPE